MHHRAFAHNSTALLLMLLLTFLLSQLPTCSSYYCHLFDNIRSSSSSSSSTSSSSSSSSTSSSSSSNSNRVIAYAHCNRRIASTSYTHGNKRITSTSILRTLKLDDVPPQLSPSTTSSNSRNADSSSISSSSSSSRSIVNNSIQQKLLGGAPLNAELVAILTVYFVQGALGLSRLAVTFFMKDELHMSPVEMAAYGGVTTLPWIIKPLYGFLSDGVPIFGYKRRSYLVLAGLMGCLSWLALGTFIHDVPTTIAATVVGSASVAISDVVVDSIVVERSRRQSSPSSSSSSETAVAAASDATADTTITTTDGTVAQEMAGNLQSLCWATAAVGGILSAYFSGSLLEVVSPRVIFTLTALFPLLISAASFLIDETPVHSTAASAASADGSAVAAPPGMNFLSTVKEQLQTLRQTFTDPRIYLPVLFVFCWQATPNPDSAMFYFSTNELGFQPEFLGRVRLASSLAALVGVTAYRTYLKDVPVKSVILWASLLSVPLSLTQLLLVTHYNRVLGIPDQLFSLTDSVVLTVLGQVAFMPTLVLASSLCPPGVEGTLFATLMSIYNAAGTVSTELGAGLTSLLGVTDTKFDQLPLLVLICSLTSLLPLPFIGAIDAATAPPAAAATATAATATAAATAAVPSTNAETTEARVGTPKE